MHTGYLTYIHNVKYLLIFDNNNDYTNAPQCCSIYTYISCFVIFTERINTVLILTYITYYILDNYKLYSSGTSTPC